MVMSLAERATSRFFFSIRSRLGWRSLSAVVSELASELEPIRRQRNRRGGLPDANGDIDVTVVAAGDRGGIKFDRQALSEAAISDWEVTHGHLKEQMRVIKRRLLNQDTSGPEEANSRGSLIMVTSARSEEGKTFTALGLAFAIAAEPNRHVLLIDLDGSPHGLRHLLNGSVATGLTDLLSDRSLDLGTLVVDTDVPRLSVLLAGSQHHHAGDLVAGARMCSVVDEIMRRYPDWLILIDAPPCLVSSIPAAIAAMVGQIVFVVEADRTQRAEVEASVDLVAHCARISLILNKTSVRTSDSFGSYAYN